MILLSVLKLEQFDLFKDGLAAVGLASNAIKTAAFSFRGDGHRK
jgi:hypothetical protein